MFPLIDVNSFDQQILSSKGLVLINFWANWCEECTQMASIMRDINNILDEQDKILQVDWDRQKQLAKMVEIFGIPTLLIYSGGEVVDRCFGIMEKDELLKRIFEAKDTFSTEKR